MKHFTKQIFAVFLGLILFLIFLFLILFIILWFNGPETKNVPQNGFLVLNLNYDIPELTDNETASILNRSKLTKLGLNDIIKVIKYASTDDRIQGIALRSGGCQSGLATIQSIRSQLIDFQQTNKKIYAYGDAYGQAGYYLSSVADSIFLNPNGRVVLKGFGVSTSHYKDGMDKYGIDANIFYKGKYKSATEKYRRNNPSDENIYQLTEYLNDISATVFSEIAESRNLTSGEINNIANHFLSRDALSGKVLGLVDTIRYELAFRSFIKSKTGLNPDEPMDEKIISASRYLEHIDLAENDSQIAVVYAEGNIAYRENELGTISNNRYRPIWNKLIKDKSTQGVVIRINSPGGSAFESDVLWKEIRRLKAADKFVTLSMGDYCASGGYYMGCAADTIVAQDVTLTGSIGAYAMNFDFSDFLDDHLGIDYESITTHPYVNINSSVHEQTEDERVILQEGIEKVYRKFLDKVAISRQRSPAEIHQVAQGRIWSGVDAKENKLVDVIGDLDTAIELTAEKLNLVHYSIAEYPKIELDFWEQYVPTNLPMVRSGLEQKIEKYLASLKNQFYFSNYEGDILLRLPYNLDF